MNSFSSKDFIFLPGTEEQINNFVKHIHNKLDSILIIGSNSEEIAKILKKNYNSSVIIIVENHESLMKSRLLLSLQKDIPVRMMEFDSTDFPGEKFDLVYAQASISNSIRNKILKEIKRILKPEGYLCVGEIVSRTKETPAFIKDIFANSEISPLLFDEIKNYYENRNFKILYEKDLSSTLEDFYMHSKNLLNSKEEKLSEEEMIFHKKLLKKISHESNAYLNLGGDAFMGFKMLILKKV